LSTAVVEKLSKKDKKDNLAELSKAGRLSQRRMRLAIRIRKRAVDVMGAAGAQKVCDEIAQGQLSLARAKRDLSKAAATKKLEAAKALARPKIETLHCCSMEEFLGKARGIDAIITDPPYKKEYVGLYGELARLSATALKPNGTLAVMVGQSYLPEILAAMTPHMKYRWQMAYLTPGPSTAVWQNGNVNTNFKPILVFGGGKRIVDDVVRSDSGNGDKVYHEWGQSESGFMRLIERLTEPNDLVCDPFIGGGTTAVAAVRLHRRIVGCDTDAAMVRTAQSRVALAQRERNVL
jgi:hypothetical protein